MSSENARSTASGPSSTSPKSSSSRPNSASKRQARQELLEETRARARSLEAEIASDEAAARRKDFEEAPLSTSDEKVPFRWRDTGRLDEIVNHAETFYDSRRPRLHVGGRRCFNHVGEDVKGRRIYRYVI